MSNKKNCKLTPALIERVLKEADVKGTRLAAQELGVSPRKVYECRHIQRQAIALTIHWIDTMTADAPPGEKLPLTDEELINAHLRIQRKDDLAAMAQIERMKAAK